jgi:hypothetical protein
MPGVVVLSAVVPAAGGEFSTESLLLPVLFSLFPQLAAKNVAVASMQMVRIRFIGDNFLVLISIYYLLNISIILPLV